MNTPLRGLECEIIGHHVYYMIMLLMSCVLTSYVDNEASAAYYGY